MTAPLSLLGDPADDLDVLDLADAQTVWGRMELKLLALDAEALCVHKQPISSCNSCFLDHDRAVDRSTDV